MPETAARNDNISTADPLIAMQSTLQTGAFTMSDSKDMEVSVDDIQIIAADRLKDGLVIKFQDGRCAFFSASLLDVAYGEAELLDESETAW